MSTGRARQPTEEELRAAYEAEIKKIRVEHLLLETIVSLVNLGMRRTGIAPGTEAERDNEQVKLSIEAIRALLPLVEQAAPQQAAPIREALSQLQLAFVRIGGRAAGGGRRRRRGRPGARGRPGGARRRGRPGARRAAGPGAPEALAGPPRRTAESGRRGRLSAAAASGSPASSGA